MCDNDAVTGSNYNEDALITLRGQWRFAFIVVTRMYERVLCRYTDSIKAAVTNYRLLSRKDLEICWAFTMYKKIFFGCQEALGCCMEKMKTQSITDRNMAEVIKMDFSEEISRDTSKEALEKEFEDISCGVMPSSIALLVLGHRINIIERCAQGEHLREHEIVLVQAWTEFNTKNGKIIANATDLLTLCLEKEFEYLMAGTNHAFLALEAAKRHLEIMQSASSREEIEPHEERLKRLWTGVEMIDPCQNCQDYIEKYEAIRKAEEYAEAEQAN